MKRILSLILLASLVFGICACGGTPQGETTQATEPATQATEMTTEEILESIPQETELLDVVKNTTVFSVGYDRQVMNPEESIPLDGYGNNDRRYCTEVSDDICSTAVAIADGQGNAVILINADLIQAHEGLVNGLRPVIAIATGIPESNIVISGTHSHSAPALNNGGELAIQNYTTKVIKKMLENALNAVADLKPATMYYGSIETEEMNFTRHYNMSDGSVTGDQFGDPTGKTYISHTFQADPTLHVVQFQREGGKDVVIANWRAHPHFLGSSTDYRLSSDYVGRYRTAFEDQTGASFLFLQGAAGNVNESSRITGEGQTKDYRVYGAIMAQYTIDCMAENMIKVEDGIIRSDVTEYYGDINKTHDHLIAQAREVQAVWTSTADRNLTMQLAEPYGIRSPYHANAIVANFSRTKENDGRMELTAISIGDHLAFVTFPGEAFDTISQHVEEGSPYDMTMFIGYANHHIGYLPGEIAYTYSSYETDITRFVQGTDAQVEQVYLDMLNGLKADS